MNKTELALILCSVAFASAALVESVPGGDVDYHYSHPYGDYQDAPAQKVYFHDDEDEYHAVPVQVHEWSLYTGLSDIANSATTGLWNVMKFLGEAVPYDADDDDSFFDSDDELSEESGIGKVEKEDFEAENNVVEAEELDTALVDDAEPVQAELVEGELVDADTEIIPIAEAHVHADEEDDFDLSDLFAEEGFGIDKLYDTEEGGFGVPSPKQLEPENEEESEGEVEFLYEDAFGIEDEAVEFPKELEVAEQAENDVYVDMGATYNHDEDDSFQMDRGNIVAVEKEADADFGSVYGAVAENLPLPKKQLKHVDFAPKSAFEVNQNGIKAQLKPVQVSIQETQGPVEHEFQRKRREILEKAQEKAKLAAEEAARAEALENAKKVRSSVVANEAYGVNPLRVGIDKGVQIGESKIDAKHQKLFNGPKNTSLLTARRGSAIRRQQ